MRTHRMAMTPAIIAGFVLTVFAAAPREAGAATPAVLSETGATAGHPGDHGAILRAAGTIPTAG